MGKKLFWIGIRESEIKDTGQLFDGSITVYGSNQNQNISYEHISHLRIDYNQENKDLNQFIDETAKNILEKFPNSSFMLYYPMDAEEYGSLVQEHIICKNNPGLTDLIENKLYTKLWLSSIVPVIPYSTIRGSEIEYEYLCTFFETSKEFVLQGTFSCGGSGTWLIRNSNDVKDILKKLSQNEIYTVAPYYQQNVSVNIHIVIYKDEILLFPASVQIIRLERHRLCYEGSDYIAIRTLPEKLLRKITYYANEIGNKLRLNGYRGICGIDFLVTTNEVFFMEINARFQSSSFLLNEVLHELHAPSLQQLNIDAFKNGRSSFQIPELSINKSFYDFSLEKKYEMEIRYLWQVAQHCPEVQSVIDDKIDWNISKEEDAYLYNLVFNTNIVSILPKCTCRTYNGLQFTLTYAVDVPWEKQLKQLKILLLNQGIRITKNALEKLAQSGGPNFMIFSAIDLSIEEKVYLNIPYLVKFSELSLFEIEYVHDKYLLNYCSHPITWVTIRTVDKLSYCKTQNGMDYDMISYLGVDRLRIHQRSGCYFKEHQIGCKFCEIEDMPNNLNFNDIREVIDAYKDQPIIQHYLVGGGSQNPNDNFKLILDIVDYIHKSTKKPIYLMTIPPNELEILDKLMAAGVTEIAFNLEIYDRVLAREYMPGKGKIPIKQYEKAFKHAVELWGNNGNVRSAFIVGLESKSSIIKGIRFLCSLGVSPILSVFKPDGEMKDFLAPSSEEIYNIWEAAENICEEFHISLGPTCHYCEDNVLKITLNNHG